MEGGGMRGSVDVRVKLMERQKSTYINQQPSKLGNKYSTVYQTIFFADIYTNLLISEYRLLPFALKGHCRDVFKRR